MKRELRLTADGSHTLYVPSLDESYHSIHGAIQESNHVFIREGFLEALNRIKCTAHPEGIAEDLYSSPLPFSGKVST